MPKKLVIKTGFNVLYTEDGPLAESVMKILLNRSFYLGERAGRSGTF